MPITLNIAEAARALSTATGRGVLMVTADPMASSLSFADLDALGEGAVAELRYSGTAVIVADTADNAGFMAVERLFLDVRDAVEENAGLHAEAILLKAGQLAARAHGEAVERSEMSISADLAGKVAK